MKTLNPYPATTDLPQETIKALLDNYLSTDPSSYGVGWGETLPIYGLLRWARHGFPECLDFAREWFLARLKGPAGQAETGIDPISGNWLSHRKDRLIENSPITFSTYSGDYGLALPCYELYLQTGDKRAREVCLAVADTVLHRAFRVRQGLSAHDDNRLGGDIPDAGFFAVAGLSPAIALDESHGDVYLKQAIYQLRAYTDIFLDMDNGLVKTILLPNGLGKSYWCRATGWLLWAYDAFLPFIPKEHPDYAGFVRDLEMIAKGVTEALGEEGSIHTFANDLSSPAESSGTAMAVTVIQNAIRNQFLPEKYQATVDKMWGFLEKQITIHPETGCGEFKNAYVLWAVPAEEGEVRIETVSYGPLMGPIFCATEALAGKN